MNNRNKFLLGLHFNKVFSRFSPEEKKKRIHSIMNDYEMKEILNPIKNKYVDDDEIYEEDENSFKTLEDMTLEERVLAKQVELGIDPEEKVAEEESCRIKGRWGRTEIHEVVLISDFNRLKELLDSKEIDIFLKDNNNQNAYQLAILEGNVEAVEIMKPYFPAK